MFWDKKPASPLNEAVIRDALGHPDWLLGVRLGPNGRVTAVIAADPENMEISEAQRIETETRLLNLEGVQDVNVALTASPHRRERESAKARACQTRRFSKALRSPRPPSPPFLEFPVFWPSPAQRAASESRRFR